MTSLIKVTPSPYDAVIKRANATLNSLSPTASASQAAQTAASQIKGQIAGSNATFGTNQQQLLNMQTRAQEFAKARASQEGAASNLAFGNYDEAARTLGALGGGLVGGAAADWDAQAQKVADQVSQMTGGRLSGPLPTQYATPAMQNAAQTLGVTLPGSSLIDQGLLAGAQARGDVAAGARQAASIGADYGAKIQDALAAHANDLAAIRATQPSLYNTALQNAQARSDRAQATLATLVGGRANWRTGQEAAVERKREFDVSAKARKATQDATTRIQTMALTHRDPDTGEPIAGWVVDPRDKSGKTLMTNELFTSMMSSNRSFRETQREFNKTLALNKQKLADAKIIANAKANKPGAYDPKLSAQVGKLVDSSGRFIKDSNGNTVTYNPKAGLRSQPLSVDDKLKIASNLSATLKQWRDGATDKNGNQTQKPLTAAKALQRMNAIGMFDGPVLRQMAVRNFMDIYQNKGALVALIDAGLIPKPKQWGMNQAGKALIAKERATTEATSVDTTPTDPGNYQPKLLPTGKIDLPAIRREAATNPLARAWLRAHGWA